MALCTSQPGTPYVHPSLYSSAFSHGPCFRPLPLSRFPGSSSKPRLVELPSGLAARPLEALTEPSCFGSIIGCPGTFCYSPSSLPFTWEVVGQPGSKNTAPIAPALLLTRWRLSASSRPFILASGALYSSHTSLNCLTKKFL